MRARVRRARARGAGLEVPTSDDRASGKVRNRKSAIQGRLDLGDFQEVWQLHQSGAFMYAALLHYSENEGRRVLPFELPIWWVGLSLRFASQFYGELMQEGRIRYEFRLDGVKGQRLGRLRDDGRRMYDDYTCLETTIEAVGMTSIAGLSTAWRSTVAAAIRPMYSLFGWEITAATIDGQLDELGR